MHADADAVDDAVEFLGALWVAQNPPVQDEGHGVKEPPGRWATFDELLERRLLEVDPMSRTIFS